MFQDVGQVKLLVIGRQVGSPDGHWSLVTFGIIGHQLF